MTQSYSIHEVATLLQVTLERARELTALAWPEAREVFGFQDLVLLRTAKSLADRKVKGARIAQALARVRDALPVDQPLSSVVMQREGREIVVGHGPSKWNAESGQGVFDLAKPPRGAAWLRPVPRRDADALFDHAVALEAENPVEAIDAYGEAVAADPYHGDAHVNLGRLLHAQGRLREAEAHYVAALVSCPTNATATFNLAVVLEDLGKDDDAMTRYREAIELDPECVDAYFNLARLYEKKGEKMSAIRHLKDYRRLSKA
jgi:tetratricopeptide (TPR) repeat protein